MATWVVPALVCVAVFWPGILAWFQRDDFAWLALRLLAASFRNVSAL